MIDGGEWPERFLVFELAVVAAGVLIDLLALLFEPEAAFIEIGDEITTFLNRLYITLTRLLHRFISYDLTALSALVDDNGGRD